MRNNFFLIPMDSNDVPIWDEVYELHATSTIKVDYSTKVNDKPTESNGKKKDNLIIEPTKLSFTGVLTDVKTGALLSVSTITDAVTGGSEVVSYSIGEYLNSMVTYQKSGTRFLAYFSGDAKYEDELDWLERVIITKLSLSKDVSLGKSWKVNISLQEEDSLSLLGDGDSGTTNSNESTQSPDEKQKCKLSCGKNYWVDFSEGTAGSLNDKPEGCEC